jgi:tRNA(His) 5'-end guanylyltransferase
MEQSPQDKIEEFLSGARIPSKDNLGDRMKEYEDASGHRLDPSLPICIRLDGRGFSKWTKGLARPFDQRLLDLMKDLTTALVEHTHAVVGYHQSDEITLVLYQPEQAWFGARIQKLTSITASFASAWMAREIPKRIPEKAADLAMFDSRAWNVPTFSEAVNVLRWRQQDARRNSVSMVAHEKFTTKELFKKSTPEMLEMLSKEGIEWESLPHHFKLGIHIVSRLEEVSFSAEDIASLPEKHKARTNPDLKVSRRATKPLELPSFSAVLNLNEIVFDGADPIYREGVKQ